MSFIPDSIVEEIRNRFDIVDVVAMYVELKKTGKNYSGLCPFHAEKAPSFTVSPDKQIFYCFGCQSGGNVFTFIMQIEDLNFPEAVRFLGEKAGIKIEDRIFSPEEKKALLLKEKMQNLLLTGKKHFEDMLWNNPRGKDAYSYLIGRGVSDETMKVFGLGFAADSWSSLTGRLHNLKIEPEAAYRAGLIGKKESRYYDYFRGRVIFPIWDQHGQIIGFGGRILGQGEPKYLNSPETPLFHKGKTLYGLHLALPQIRKDKEAHLVEGYLDVLLLHQYGIKTAIAPLGTSLTEKHVALLRGRLEKITLVFDGDTGGERAALRSLKLLKDEGCQVRIAELPTGMDPADYVLEKGVESFRREILDEALPLVEYQISRFKKGVNLQKKEDRLQYWQKTRGILEDLTETLEREEYLKKIAGEIDVALEVLRGDLEKSIVNKQRRLSGSFSGTKNSKVLPDKTTKNLNADQGFTIKEMAERELLSSVLQDPVLNEELWKQIEPVSFTPGPLQEIARSLYTLFCEKKETNVSALLDCFSAQEMHKLITEMATPLRRGEDSRAQKRMNDCLKRLRALHWAEEREMLIKSMSGQGKPGAAEVSASLQRIQDLKVREEELYRSVEGELVDG